MLVSVILSCRVGESFNFEANSLLELKLKGWLFVLFLQYFFADFLRNRYLKKSPVNH